MKAAVVHGTGGPLAFKIEERPMPTPKPGQVLIHIKASGLNRSELFTRQGHSPNVHFPRILGIEATGLVEDAPGGEFQKSDVVAAAMGEMGRANDGGYAECTVVPAKTDNSLPGPSSAPAARCCKRPTARCMTGIVGNSWTPATFAPMGSIPTSVCLTAYSGGSEESKQTPLQELVEQIEAGSLQVSVAKTFRLDEIADAHRMMEENRAGGKLVVLPWCDSLLSTVVRTPSDDQMRYAAVIVHSVLVPESQS